METAGVLINRKGKRDPWASRAKPKRKPIAWRYRKGLSGKQWSGLEGILRVIRETDPLYEKLTDDQVAYLIKTYFGIDVVRREFIDEARKFVASAIQDGGYPSPSKAKAEKP